MIHAWPPGAKFFEGLWQVDAQAVVGQQQRGCPRCGGRLDRADFPRKVRGISPTWEGLFRRRFSLCCAREGCRRRVTPPSVRFLGRRVYAAVVVLTASLSAVVAMVVPRATRKRWAAWWCGAFVESAFFREARGLLMPPVQEAGLPASLVARFLGESVGVDSYERGLLKALSFVSALGRSGSSSSRDGP